MSTPTPTNKPVYCLEFEPASGNWIQTPDQRIKALLKRALRTHGLVCRMAVCVQVKEGKTDASAS